MKHKESTLRQIFHPVVIVGALGYFVDVYDLILFSILRIPSLKGLGYSGDLLVSHGVLLLNLQMLGMLVGGIFFGILGDRIGRVALLFGSILLYSLANIANGFVHSIESYAVWRFIAGFGLAGELGGGITLVTEVLPRNLRGYGTAIVSSVGVFGAVIGGLVAQKVEWRTAYFIGGGLGLCLLILRLGVAESGMFKKIQTTPTHVSRGNFLILFTDLQRFMKYLRCILVGLPLWCIVGILVTFSPEISRTLKIQGEEITAGHAVMYTYLGITFGGYASGHFSQLWRSRRKVLFAFLGFTVAAVAAYFASRGVSSSTFYLVVLLMGFGVGYWTIFVTVAAEQFGTNIRATVATTVPNFVRGATVLLTLAFNYLKTGHGVIFSAEIISFSCLAVALWSVIGMEETHGKDLDYVEVP
jgi:MFS family permease